MKDLRITLRFIVILLFAWAAIGAYAAEDDSTKPDARLSQKVTYEAKHRSVKLILADLSKMTGVTLKAGYGDSDWQVRDRKMNVFVKDVPLLNLMNSMGRVMKFIWSKNAKVDPPTYRMYMDRMQLSAAEAARNKAAADWRQDMMDRRAKLLDYIKDPPNYSSPAELEKLKKENPYLYLMHQRGTDRLLKALLEEVPGYEDAFMNYSRILNPPASMLSNSTLGLLLSCAKAKWAMYGGRGAEFPADIDLAKLKTGLVRLTVPTETFYGRGDTLWCFGGIGLKFLEGDRDIFVEHLQDPDNAFGNARAVIESEAVERNESYRSVMDESKDEMESLWREDARKRNEAEGGEPPIEHPDEPWLHAKVKYVPQKEDPTIPRQVLSALAKASGYSVISDSFELTGSSGQVAEGEQELAGVLEVISKDYCYNWTKHGSTLEFRRRDWFKMRSSQIPDEWMDRWKANFKANGRTVLEDMAQMAGLSQVQIMEALMRDRVSNLMFRPVRGSLSVLRFYNSLSPSQRRLLSKGSLELGALAPDQYDTVLDAFQPDDTWEWNAPKFWEDPQETITFSGVYERDEKDEPCFTITARGKDGAVYYQQRVSFIAYVEPPQPNKDPGSAKAETKIKQPAGK